MRAVTVFVPFNRHSKPLEARLQVLWLSHLDLIGPAACRCRGRSSAAAKSGSASKLLGPERDPGRGGYEGHRLSPRSQNVAGIRTPEIPLRGDRIEGLNSQPSCPPRARVGGAGVDKSSVGSSEANRSIKPCLVGYGAIPKGRFHISVQASRLFSKTQSFPKLWEIERS